jgi:amidase
MVGADVGSDMGGSIRIPAHYCGVCGIKPTWNIVPQRGHSLQNDVRCADINVAGPIAREPSDLALLLSVLAGPGEFDAAGWKLELPQPDNRPLAGFRLADSLSDGDILEPAQNEHRTRNARGATLRHREWLLLHEQRQLLRRAWEEFFTEFDAFLCPVASTAAPPLKPGRQILERTIEVNGTEIPMLDQHFWAALASLPYLPSVVIPIGTTDYGLPVGMQIVGRCYSDLQMIFLAGLMHSQIGTSFETA